MEIQSTSLIQTITSQLLVPKLTTIWVCDEDAAVQSMIRFKLQQERPNLKVLAVDPSWMLELLPLTSVNLLVIDAGTNLEKGLTLIARLRKSMRHPIPILAFLAEGQEREAFEALQAGATDFLIKPFSLEELFVRIVKQLKLR